MGWVANANATVARYTAWKRAWDAMGPGGAPPHVSDRPAFKVAVLVLAVVALAVFLSAHPNRPGYALAFNWLMGGGTCALVGWLAVRRFRSTARPIWAPKKRDREADVVSLGVCSPPIRVPDLKGLRRSARALLAGLERPLMTIPSTDVQGSSSNKKENGRWEPGKA